MDETGSSMACEPRIGAARPTAIVEAAPAKAECSSRSERTDFEYPGNLGPTGLLEGPI